MEEWSISGLNIESETSQISSQEYETFLFEVIKEPKSTVLIIRSTQSSSLIYWIVSKHRIYLPTFPRIATFPGLCVEHQHRFTVTQSSFVI